MCDEIWPPRIQIQMEQLCRIFQEPSFPPLFLSPQIPTPTPPHLQWKETIAKFQKQFMKVCNQLLVLNNPVLVNYCKKFCGSFFFFTQVAGSFKPSVKVISYLNFLQIDFPPQKKGGKKVGGWGEGKKKKSMMR